MKNRDNKSKLKKSTDKDTLTYKSLIVILCYKFKKGGYLKCK